MSRSIKKCGASPCQSQDLIGSGLCFVHHGKLLKGIPFRLRKGFRLPNTTVLNSCDVLRCNKVCTGRSTLCPAHKNRATVFGLSEDELIELFDLNDGLCHVCLVTAGNSIDHDHSCCPAGGSCGRCVRGLLCSNCNLALGMLRDSKASLQSAIEYLQRYENKRLEAWIESGLIAAPDDESASAETP